MTLPSPQPGILDIALYVSGESTLAGRSDILKLSANENPLGFSDKARDAFLRAGQALHRYPGTDHAALRRAIAEVHGLDPDRIICGVGSDEVLQFIAQAYAGPGDEVIVTEHGFSMYPILARAVGATPVEVAERERRIDVDAILAALSPRSRIVFIANPANPTGTFLPADEVRRLAAALPPNVVLVHDGAYTEYVEGFDGGAALVDEFANVIMTRTFSKAYGLGGLRVGWGYGARGVIDVLNRLRQPFNLSDVQMTVAEAAMLDQDFLRRCQTENARWRDWLRAALIGHGLQVDESHANFLLARFADADQAAGCDDALRAAGIIVRRVAGYKLPQALRITVGDEAACRRVAHAVGQFMASAR